MPDRLLAENGKLTLTTEEGRCVERPEADLDAMYREELLPPLDGEALPDGVKFADWRNPFLLIVHQMPPHVRQLRWIAEDSPEDFGPETKYRKVRLSLPYAITFALFVKHGPKLHLTGANELYFRNEPLRRKNDRLGYPALLNISCIKAPGRMRCWICTQHLPRSREAGWPLQLQRLIEHTFNGGFNRSSERHEGQSTYGYSQGIHPDLHPVERWQEASADDAFALKVPWREVPLCVGELMDHLFQEAAAGLGHHGGPARSGAGLLTRFLGFVQRSQT